MHLFPKSAIGLSVLAALFSASAAPLMAQTMRTKGPPPDDPVLQLAQWSMPRNQFVLNSQEDVEIVRYTTPHDVEVCINRPDANNGVRKAVPVQVKWDNNTSVVQPGNCLSFDAKLVKVKMSAPLPESEDLFGTFRVIH